MDRRAALMLLLLLAGCARKAPLLEDLAHHQDLSRFTVQAAHGLRDGDHLAAQFLVSDSSSILIIDMRFAVGSPTRLEMGAWRWARSGSVSHGDVQARSVTFLGGQDGPPSVGGDFDLVGADSHYRLNLPVTVLQRAPARP
jgi:hypothetical protein